MSGEICNLVPGEIFPSVNHTTSRAENETGTKENVPVVVCDGKHHRP